MNDLTMWNSGKYEDYLVFNKGKFIGVLTEELFKEMLVPLGPPAPRGATPNPLWMWAFIYNRKSVITGGNFGNKRWWRVDGTPRIMEEIPKEYLAMACLYN